MRRWIPLLIVAAAFLASALVYPDQPERMPTDLVGLGGELPMPAGSTQRFLGAWMIPFMILFVWALMRWLPSIDPRGANYAKFGGAFDSIMLSVMLFMLGVHVITLCVALGLPVAVERVMPAGVGLLFIVIGNLLPRARPNWFVGIRTPWTLSSDRVWEKTHRVGGRMFVVGGIIIAVTALSAGNSMPWVAGVVIAACTLGAVIYSYVEWRKEKEAPPLPPSDTQPS